MEQINRSRLYDTFQALVSIDSPSLDEAAVGAYVKARLHALGASVTEDDAGERLGGTCGNLFCRWQGSLPREAPLWFSAHLDTVEPAKGKKAILLPDGTIQSNGNTVLGADDMAGVAAILEAMETISQQGLPHREVELLFTVAEEIYSGGASRFDYSVMRAREGYVLDLTGPVGSCAYHAPTIFAFTATFSGKPAHAGFAPETGANAIAAAANAIASISQGRVDEGLTVNIGLIQGGTATNIVSHHCVLNGEIRSDYHNRALEQYDLIQARFRAAAGALGVSVAFSHRIGCLAYELPKDAPVIRRVERGCQKSGLPFRLIKTFGGSDNNHFVRHGLSGVVLACGMEDCHSVKEHSHIDELARAAQLVLCLMTDAECA